MKLFSHFLGVALAATLAANASAAFVLNEVDADTPGGDADEFVELKGNPGEPATGLILVFFDGAASGGTKSYRTVDLASLTANSQGYILLGDAAVPNVDMVLPDGFIQNGEDAVALYQALATSFPNGTVPTTTGLVDLLVYDNAQTNRNWSGFGSPTVYNEGGAGTGGVTEHSLARVPDATGTWTQTVPTPKAANNNATFALTEPFFPRMNQATAAVATTRTFTLRNTGPVPLTVHTFALSPASSPEFLVVVPPFIAAPVTLQYDESTSMTVQFFETDVSANQTYTGSITYTTDNPTSPSGTMNFSTELVRATAAPVGSVVVNEICYNPGTTDHNGDGSTANQNDEFVELFNTTSADILIEGWEQRCQDGASANFHSFVFPAGTTIPANGLVTVFTSGTPTGFLPGTTFTYGIPRISNAGAFVGISDASKLIDGVSYLNAEDTPDVDGYKNAGVAIGGGGSIGRRPDGASAFRTFLPTDLVVTDRPSPNGPNAAANVSGWSLY